MIDISNGLAQVPCPEGLEDSLAVIYQVEANVGIGHGNILNKVQAMLELRLQTTQMLKTGWRVIEETIYGQGRSLAGTGHALGLHLRTGNLNIVTGLSARLHGFYPDLSDRTNTG